MLDWPRAWRSGVGSQLGICRYAPAGAKVDAGIAIDEFKDLAHGRDSLLWQYDLQHVVKGFSIERGGRQVI